LQANYDANLCQHETASATTTVSANESKSVQPAQPTTSASASANARKPERTSVKREQ
jgi:hypothetical protein